MMSSSAIVVIVVVTVILLAIFTYMTIYGISHGRVGRTGRAGKAEIEAASMRPVKILVATDGSACSDRAVQTVAMRPWPRGSEVELVSVIHTNVPFVPEVARRCPHQHSGAWRGFEQVDWVPVRIEQLNLLAARAHDNIVSTAQAAILHGAAANTSAFVRGRSGFGGCAGIHVS